MDRHCLVLLCSLVQTSPSRVCGCVAVWPPGVRACVAAHVRALYLPGAAYFCAFLPALYFYSFRPPTSTRFLPACTSTRSYHLLLLVSYPAVLLLVPTMQHVHIPTYSYMLHVYMFVEGFDRGSTEVRQRFDSCRTLSGSTEVRQSL